MKEKVNLTNPLEKHILKVFHVYAINAKTLTHGVTGNFGLKCVVPNVSKGLNVYQHSKIRELVVIRSTPYHVGGTHSIIRYTGLLNVEMAFL